MQSIPLFLHLTWFQLALHPRKEHSDLPVKCNDAVC